jgi:hypothetical protein
MNYSDLIKRAYQLTIKNRFLWIFGIFLGGMAAFGDFNQFNKKSFNSLGLDQAKISNFVSQHVSTVLHVAVGLIVFILIMIILSILAQGGLIGSADQLNQGKKTNFSLGFKTGLKHFWRILSLGLIASVLVILVLFILSLPLALLISAKIIWLAIIWGIISILIFLALIIALNLVFPYSLRFLVIEDKSIFESLNQGTKFVLGHIGPVILIYLISIAASIIFMTAFFLAVIIVGGLLFGIGYVLWLASVPVAIFYSVVAALVLLIAIITVSSMFKTFQSVLITLGYEKLKNQIKSDLAKTE